MQNQENEKQMGHSRVLKFRAWDGKKMVLINNWKIIKGVLTCDDKLIMQFTGLKDKNGKEIYEGDIVKITRTNWYCPGHSKHNTDLVDQEEIYWDEERNAMSVRTFDFERLKRNSNQAPYSSSGYLGNGWNDERADKNIVEIIGNIYENSELLNNK